MVLLIPLFQMFDLTVHPLLTRKIFIRVFSDKAHLNKLRETSNQNFICNDFLQKSFLSVV